eukprot:2325020-Pyramimonas_sp.AAC.1
MHGGGLYANNPQEHGWTTFPPGQNLPTETVHIDQCATGLQDTAGEHIKKPTNITSNDETIVKPFERLKCNGQHVHAQ